MRDFEFVLLAEPGPQPMCRILGVVSLSDPAIVSAVVESKPRGAMSIQLRLTMETPERAALLLARLRNLVDVRSARMVAA